VQHLWLRGGRFPDWIADDIDDLRVCELYHCTPEEADEIDYHRARVHRAIKSAESIYLKRDAEENARFRSLNRGR
jgi:hypothetical protein